MQADALGCDCSVALVLDRLTIDQRKGAQRRHSLVQAIIGERQRQGLAEVHTACFREQEERDRLRRQQRRVHDQRLGGRMQLGRLTDRERKGLRYR